MSIEINAGSKSVSAERAEEIAEAAYAIKEHFVLGMKTVPSVKQARQDPGVARRPNKWNRAYQAGELMCQRHNRTLGIGGRRRQLDRSIRRDVEMNGMHVSRHA